MPREKMHRIEKRKVRVPDVQRLIKLQSKRNEELKGSGCKCDLKPKKDKKACVTCTMFKECTDGTKLAHKAISESVSKKRARRRKRKLNNPKKQINPEWIKEKTEDLVFEE